MRGKKSEVCAQRLRTKIKNLEDAEWHSEKDKTHIIIEILTSAYSYVEAHTALTYPM